jgi:hypothetical protein
MKIGETSLYGETSLRQNTQMRDKNMSDVARFIGYRLPSAWS